MSALLKNKAVSIRKVHQCHGCGRSFPKGTLMTYQAVADCGISSTYWCPVCEEVIATDPQYYCSALDDGITFSDVKYGDIELWERTRLNIEGAEDLSINRKEIK